MSLHQKAIECGITPSSREENEKLFRRIEDGVKATKRLIEGNMGYVVTKVERFLDEHPEYGYLKDDFIGEGFLELAKLAESVSQQEDYEGVFNPQGLISVSLKNRFLKMIDRSVEHGMPLTEAITDTLSYDHAMTHDLKLDILSCCQDDTERMIVKHRCDGLIDDEIAELLGMSRFKVYRLRAEIYKRFQEKQEQ